MASQSIFVHSIRFASQKIHGLIVNPIEKRTQAHGAGPVYHRPKRQECSQTANNGAKYG